MRVEVSVEMLFFHPLETGFFPELVGSEVIETASADQPEGVFFFDLSLLTVMVFVHNEVGAELIRVKRLDPEEAFPFRVHAVLDRGSLAAQ